MIFRNVDYFPNLMSIFSLKLINYAIKNNYYILYGGCFVSPPDDPLLPDF